jgi:hypothetical protein
MAYAIALVLQKSHVIRSFLNGCQALLTRHLGEGLWFDALREDGWHAKHCSLPARANGDDAR